MDRPRKWRKNAPLTRHKRHIKRLLTSAPIVTMAARGASRKAIAEECGVSDDAVGKHLTRAMTRAGETTEEERQHAARMRPPAAPGTPRRRALELRMSGLCYDDIAAELGRPEPTIKYWVLEELRRLDADELTHADLAQRMELERLSALGAAHWDRACSGDLKSGEFYLRIMERRSKLLGLDAAVRVNIEDRLREEARRLGLDEHDVLAAAEDILRKHKQGA